jgi:queuine tRNA-ribosyltransferase
VKHFSLRQTDGGARRGTLTTAHGVIETPAFMPVGSQAGVKTLTPAEVGELGFGIMLANAYHLYLRPGAEVIQAQNGLHNFMNWDGALLTDSGGFQIFSLPTLRKVTDAGVTFRSHLDGSEQRITPESIVDFQNLLGSDILMALDECPPIGDKRETVAAAVRRTTEWAARCRHQHRSEERFLYAIVQGGIFPDLRERSAAELIDLDFPGYAIGGLSLGEPKAQTFETAALTAACLPTDKPRYLMGVGAPEDLVNGVALGCDIFDSVLPTRVARHGAFYTRHGRRNLRAAQFRLLDGPLEDGCDCPACRNFSAAYLHHLFRAGELLSLRLMTQHNLRFLARLMADVRQSIENGNFSQFKDAFLADYRPTDEAVRLSQKEKWERSRQVKQVKPD